MYKSVVNSFCNALEDKDAVIHIFEKSKKYQKQVEIFQYTIVFLLVS